VLPCSTSASVANVPHPLVEGVPSELWETACSEDVLGLAGSMLSVDAPALLDVHRHKSTATLGVSDSHCMPSVLGVSASGDKRACEVAADALDKLRQEHEASLGLGETVQGCPPRATMPRRVSLAWDGDDHVDTVRQTVQPKSVKMATGLCAIQQNSDDNWQANTGAVAPRTCPDLMLHPLARDLQGRGTGRIESGTNQRWPPSKIGDQSNAARRVTLDWDND